MKTKLLFTGFALLTGVTLFISSCTKNDSFTNGSAGYVNYVEPKMGSIIDSGFYKSDLRHMHAEFLNQGNISDPLTGDILGTASQVVIGFNSNSDLVITPGTYTFSNSKEVQPYTFNSGYVTEQFLSDPGDSNMHVITGGLIDVDLIGDQYVITYQCNLEGGYFLTGTYAGKMDYTDAVFK